MSEAKYTKGPWVIHESNAIVGEKLDDHPIWLRPVIARFATGVRPADARLMAVAPELLEQLKKMADHVEAMMAHIEHKPDRFKQHCWQQAVDTRALIAKATGGQP